MTLSQWSISCGLLAVFSFVLFRLIRERTFAGADIAPLMGVFLAGCNIPAAMYLIYYGFDPQPNKLDNYEKFISMAGLSLLATACITIYSTIWPNRPFLAQVEQSEELVVTNTADQQN